MNVKEINIDEIQIVENSRIAVKNVEGMMRDIEQNGLKQAIGVTTVKGGGYVIIWGNRRLAACKKLGWKKIWANVQTDMEMGDLLIANMAENIHREDISPMELGRICDRLKKMGLNNSEIAARLNVPATRVVSSMDIYYQLPDKYRKRVSYIGGTTQKDGKISASVVSKIISVKRQYGLSDAAMEKLMTIAKMDELSTSQINLINVFLKSGLTVTQSIEKSKDFTPARVDVFVNIKEMDNLLTKYKMDSSIMLLQSILYGVIPPLKKPDFVEIRQIPDKASLK